MNFGQIQRAVMDYIRKTEITHHIKEIINSAMRDIERDYNFNTMLTTTTGTIPSDTVSISLPTNFKDVLNFGIETSTDVYYFLQKDAIQNVLQNIKFYANSTGVPGKYAVYGNAINFYPKTDKAYNYVLDYFKYSDELVNTTDENFWTNQGSDILKFMSLFEAYNFLGDEKRAIMFYQLAQDKIQKLLRVEGNRNIVKRMNVI